MEPTVTMINKTAIFVYVFVCVCMCEYVLELGWRMKTIL